MADNLPHPNPTSFDQGNNIPNTSPAYMPKVGESSQLKLAQNCEIYYDQILVIFPITCKFEKSIGLITGVHNIPYFLKKNPTTPNGIMVYTIEYLVLGTLEELAEFVENKEKLEQSPSYNGGDRDNVVISKDIFCRLGGDEEEEEP